MARRFFSERGRSRRLGQQFDRTSAELESRQRNLSREADQRALAFDPSQAVTEFGRGFVDEASENVGQQFDRLVGGSVGAGRLRTGFFQDDAGRLFQDFNKRVANAIAQQSLEASRQNLANIQGLQRTGTDLLGQQIDLLGGAFDRATAEENASGGGFFSKLGGALGFGAGLIGDIGGLFGKGAAAVGKGAAKVGRGALDLGRDIFKDAQFGQFGPPPGPTQGRTL